MQPLSLRFRDGGEERRFREDWALGSLAQFRATLLLGMAIYTIFGIVDLLIAPDAVPQIAVIRVAVVASAAVGSAFLWFRPAAILPRLQEVGVMLGTMAGLGIVGMTLIATGEAAITYYAGVLGTMVYAGALIRLRFLPALVSIVTMGVGYAATLPLNREISPAYVVNNLAFVLMIGGMSVAAAYGLERVGREAFTGRRRVEEQAATLAEALTNVRELSGLIPVCAWCHKVRDDDGYWQRLELYLRDHSRAEISHGICPECYAKIDQVPAD